jgi:prepilin-type processing-associated H-X9-DG protein
MHNREKARPEKKSKFSFVNWMLGLFALWIALWVLFPAGKVSDKTRSWTCQSNMKQLGLGLLQYTQDFDQKLPNGLQSSSSGGGIFNSGVGWASQVYTYIKDPAAFICPQDTTPKFPGQGQVVSYAINSNIVNTARWEDWDREARTVMLFEVSGAHSLVVSDPTAEQVANGPLAPAGVGTESTLTDGQTHPSVRLATGTLGYRNLDGLPGGRHEGGANYLMGDGHVMLLMPEQVSTGYDATTQDGPQTGIYIGKAAGTSNRRYRATFSTK